MCLKPRGILLFIERENYPLVDGENETNNFPEDNGGEQLLEHIDVCDALSKNELSWSWLWKMQT